MPLPQFITGDTAKSWRIALVRTALATLEPQLGFLREGGLAAAQALQGEARRLVLQPRLDDLRRKLDDDPIITRWRHSSAELARIQEQVTAAGLRIQRAEAERKLVELRPPPTGLADRLRELDEEISAAKAEHAARQTDVGRLQPIADEATAEARRHLAQHLHLMSGVHQMDGELQALLVELVDAAAPILERLALHLTARELVGNAQRQMRLEDLLVPMPPPPAPEPPKKSAPAKRGFFGRTAPVESPAAPATDAKVEANDKPAATTPAQG